MSFNNLVIKADNLCKAYKIFLSPAERLKDQIPSFINKIYSRSKSTSREFWAIKDVSFEIKQGESFGIIGRNGAGKSTLLQLICGTLTPTSGSIECNGKIAALLELGSGFNPEFTGIENIYLNGSILGLKKKEIDAKLESILAFADIGDFVHQAVKTYSSGMALRLAFAVQAYVDSDILIIDEALAVGDINFQQKCMRFLENYKNNGGTLIFVSHDSSAIKALCNKVIYLNRVNGHTRVKIGETAEICELYLQDQIEEKDRNLSLQQKTASEHLIKSKTLGSTIDKKNFKLENECMYELSAFQRNLLITSKEGAITNVYFSNQSNQLINSFKGVEILIISVCIETFKKIEQPSVDFIIKDRLGQLLISESTGPVFLRNRINFPSNSSLKVHFKMMMPPLANGSYSIDFVFSDGTHYKNQTIAWINDGITLKASGNRNVVGIMGLSELEVEVEI